VHCNEQNSIGRWGSKIIWKPPNIPLPEPDGELELGIEDIFGECADELPSDDPRRSRTVSISLEDLRSWCTNALGLDLKGRPEQFAVQLRREGFNRVAGNPWGVELSKETDQESPTASDSGPERGNGARGYAPKWGRPDIPYWILV
jgi:hypothetical protein